MFAFENETKWSVSYVVEAEELSKRVDCASQFKPNL